MARRIGIPGLVGALLLLLAAALVGQESTADEVSAANQGNGAVVLMYHRFGEDRYPSTSIRMEQFRGHVRYLESEGFNVWPLERVVAYLKEDRPFPPRTVAITMDDAYRSIYEQAYPILREKDWPYTVFVNSDGTDGGNSAYMTWDQMREMAAESEARFANHSASHDYLLVRREGESASEWEARVRADIQQATDRLEAELGEDAVPRNPRLHAYPYGEYDAALQDILADMGFVAFGQHSGPVGHHSDLLGLPRFAMAESYGSPSDFRLRINTLPLPVVSQSPSDPTAIDRQDPPELRLRFAETDIALDRMNCFASGNPASIDWQNDDGRVAVIRAENAMGEGRSRYNCTVPAGDDRFHWYSFQWVKGR